MTEALKQLQAAFMLLSRLPVSICTLEERHFASAQRWFVVVGLVIGLLSAGIYWLADGYFSNLSACIITLIAGLLITGAIHEDGFADCCDGFGGGHTPERIQSIMKDSRLGTYAVLGLISLFAFKLAMLSEINAEQQLLAFALMHPLARLAPLGVMRLLPYANSGNSKMTAAIQLKSSDLLISALLCGGLLIFLLSLSLTAALILSLLTVVLLSSRYFKKRLNGYNGDCLGAVEQLSECTILLIFAIYY